MLDKEQRENNKFFKQCKKVLESIISHNKYESFSCKLSHLEERILTMIGQAESYNDLPNCDCMGMLKRIKNRMLGVRN